MEQSFLPELGYPTNYISVIWTGFLEAPLTETFTFYVNSFKSCEFTVTLNGVQIITDRSEQLGSYFQSQEVYLTKGQLYEIEVKFAKKLGASMIKLIWESDSQSFEVIPSARFFNQLNSAESPYLFMVVPASTSATQS